MSVDLTDLVQSLTEERDAAVREADRWRHGVMIEGDYVCPTALERDSLAARLAEAERERDEQQMRTIRVTSDNEQIERDTAEAIARWLDGDCQPCWPKEIAKSIRNGAWRAGSGEK